MKMSTKKNKKNVNQFSTFYFWVQQSRRNINNEMIRRFGPGFENRTISDGPIKNLNYFAPKRLFDSKRFWNGTFEEELCDYLRKSIRKDAVCYDIGSESGYNALVMAQTAKNGQVYAFEPMPQMCNILQINIEINHKENIAVVPKAVSGTEGKIRLDLSNHVDQSAFTMAAEDGTVRNICESVECNAITLDDFVEENKPPDLVKINADGLEADVLLGARRVLKKHHPLIICDTHNPEAARIIYEILSENNYELHVVKDGMWPVYSPQDMPGNMFEGHVLARQ